MDNELTQESFDKFLNLLAPNREEAAREFETLRRKLVHFFSMRRTSIPEELADQTISIIVRKVNEDIKIQDVSRYALGVARNVLLNSRRKESLLKQFEDVDRYAAVDATDYMERTADLDVECLDMCLKQLDADERNMFLKYYKERKYVSRYRARLVKRLGINPNVLRIKVLRIRRKLEKCIIECTKKNKSS